MFDIASQSINNCQRNSKQKFTKFYDTVERRLSGPRLFRISRLSGLFLWSQFGYDYLLVTIKIPSHIRFKTTALKGAVKCKGFLLSKSKGSARACRKVGLN